MVELYVLFAFCFASCEGWHQVGLTRAECEVRRLFVAEPHVAFCIREKAI